MAYIPAQPIDVSDRSGRALGSVTVSGTVTTSATVTGAVTANAGTGTFAISAASLPLPAGAATSALQTSGNTSLTSIATSTANIPAPGQALAAASLPVVLTAAQITTLTPPTTITANAGTGTFTTQQSNVQSDYDTGAGTQSVTLFGVGLPASGGAVAGGTGTNPLRTDPTGTTTQPVSGTVAVTGTFWQATQPVSAASLPLPTGAAADATLTGGTAITVIKTTAKGTTAAGQPTSTATDANTQALHTNVVNFPASQAVTGTFWQATQPVSGTVTANAGTGNFTVVQATGTNLHTVVDSGTVTLGAGAAAVGTVGVTSLPALSAGTNTIGSVKVTDGTNTATVSAAGAVKVDGSAVNQPVIAAAGTLLNQASAAQTASGQSATLPSGTYDTALLGLTITASSGTTQSQSIQFVVESLGADAVWYPLWTSDVLPGTLGLPYQIVAGIGPGTPVPLPLGTTIRLRWIVGGTSPSWTFSGSLIGQ